MAIFRDLFFALLILFIISCSTHVSDGGTDFPNTKTVSGLIKNTDGEFTDSIWVYVLPKGYRLDLNIPILNDLITSTFTDSNGYYELEVTDSNRYNILALDLRKRDRLFERNVFINGSDYEVDTLSLTKTGSLIVPFKGNSIGYHNLIIVGTNYEPEIYDDYAIFDSLPEAIFPAVLLFGEKIADSIEIKSNETKTIATAIYVVKYENNAIDSFDTNVLTEMKKCGLNFTVIDQNEFTLADTLGVSLIVISSSVDQDTLKDVFTEIQKPIINFEYYMQPYLSMTDTVYDTDYGSENDYIAVNIINSSHEIVDGLTGSTTLFEGLSHLDWGVPVGDVEVLAVSPNDSTKAMIYCFDKGDNMNTITAPARRGSFLFWRQNSFLINDTGWDIVRNMLIWSLK